jgi:hypothetical protein
VGERKKGGQEIIQPALSNLLVEARLELARGCPRWILRQEQCLLPVASCNSFIVHEEEPLPARLMVSDLFYALCHTIKI